MFLLIDVMQVTQDRSMSGSSMNLVTYSACSSMSSMARSPRERSDMRIPSPLVEHQQQTLELVCSTSKSCRPTMKLPHRCELIECCRDLDRALRESLPDFQLLHVDFDRRDCELVMRTKVAVNVNEGARCNSQSRDARSTCVCGSTAWKSETDGPFLCSGDVVPE